MPRRFWSDEEGSASPEWAFLVTILVLGAITGVVMQGQLEQAHREQSILEVDQ